MSAYRQPRKMAGAEGVALAEWSAIRTWLCGSLGNEWAITACGTLAGAAVQKMRGWRTNLAGMTRLELKELGTMAADAREAWTRAGRPHLAESIREAQRIAGECLRIANERAAGRSVGWGL